MAYRNAYIYFAIADCIVWTLEIMKNLFLFLAIVLNILKFHERLHVLPQTYLMICELE